MIRVGAECVPAAAGHWLLGSIGSEGAAGVAPSAGVLSLGFDRYLGYRHRHWSIRWRLGTVIAALVEAGHGKFAPIGYGFPSSSGTHLRAI